MADSGAVPPYDANAIRVMEFPECVRHEPARYRFGAGELHHVIDAVLGAVLDLHLDH